MMASAMAETGPAVTAAIERGAKLSLRGEWSEAERAFAGIRALDPTHPAGAYFPAQVLHWRQYEDELDPRLHAPLVEALERAVGLAERRIEANDDDAEAYLYGGQALIELGRHLALTGHVVSGGSKGEDGREWLERALALEPDRADAACPLGAYYYFASLVPRAAKMLDWLWFVPKGDHDRGLALLARCREDSRLRSLEARWLLFYIQGRFESPPPPEALEMGRSLRAEFPDNAVIHAELARLLLHRGALDDAIDEARRVEARVLAGDATYDAKIGNLARHWRARAQLLQGDLDGALATVERIDPAGPPYWIGAWRLLTRAQVADLRGERTKALGLYERIIDLDERDDISTAVAAARRCIEAPCRNPSP